MKALNQAVILNKMTKTQRAKFALLNKKEKKKYLFSFCGFKSRVTHFDFPSNTSAVVKELRSTSELRAILDSQFNTTSFKKPITHDTDHYGVEIECFLKRDDFSASDGGDCDGSCRDNCECYSCSQCGQHDENNECDCECDDTCGGNGSDGIGAVAAALKRARIKGIEVASDGSLSSDDSDYFGVEIKVLTRFSDQSNLKKLCEWLSNQGAVINATCGLHVHVDVRALNREERDALARHYGYALPVLSLMVPKSRAHDNNYCKLGVSYSDRYYAVNAAAIEKHKTIEIRLHSGTTNFEKISNWIAILHGIKSIGLPRQGLRLFSSNITCVITFFKRIGVSASVKAYAMSRIQKFNPDLLDDTVNEETRELQSEETEELAVG